MMTNERNRQVRAGYPHPESCRLVYWKREVSGTLEVAVLRFKKGLPLHPDLFEALRRYCQHWIDFDGWVIYPNQKDLLAKLRTQIQSVKTTTDLKGWLSIALTLGIDPF